MTDIFFNVIVVSVGLVTGSFMNVLIYRIPRGISIVTPPSSCTVCSEKIRWYSNIPLLSYIFQKGRCRSCGNKISLRYPLVEFSTAVIFLFISLKFGMTLLTVKYCLFVFLLLAAAYTDIDTRLDKSFDCGYIPDHYTIGGVLAGYIIALTFGDVDFADSLAGSGAGVFSLLIVNYLFKLIRKIDGMGEGDAMLTGMAGSFLGAGSILFIITLSAVLGSIAGIIVVRAVKNPRYEFPFGPMISIASVAYIFAGSLFNGFIGF